MSKELSEVKKKSIEEDIRSYKKLYSEAITAVLSKEWKPEDLNSWIRGSQTHTEKALTDLIKKEANPAYRNRMDKIDAVNKMMVLLPEELKQIVEIYMWGEYTYLKWPEIAEREHCSSSTMYRWRDKIIETYAEQYGEIF